MSTPQPASDTPETDAAIKMIDVAFVGSDGTSSAPEPYIEPDFAREQERRIAALTRERDALLADEAHLRERLVRASDINVFAHVRLAEAGIPDHVGENETYRSFGISERIDQLAKFKRRLEWLHEGGGKDTDGYEWGIYRVKWDDNGQPVMVWQTNSDFNDLDAEMAREKAIKPATA